MNVEQIIKEMIADLKKIEVNKLNFAPNSNFIEELSLDSFEVVSFVDKLDSRLNIDFGSHAADFDSLKSWSSFLQNLKNKLIINHELNNGK